MVIIIRQYRSRFTSARPPENPGLSRPAYAVRVLSFRDAAGTSVVHHRSPVRRPQASHLEPARAPNLVEGMMELLIGFVTTLFISLLIFRK
jgi:hypothetical protein